MGNIGVAPDAGQPQEASGPGAGSVKATRRRRRGAFLLGIRDTRPPMAALGNLGKASAVDGLAEGGMAAEPVAGARRRDVRSWLAQVGMFTMVGVGVGVAADGLPDGTAGVAAVGLLIAASACWGVALSGRVRDLRVLVPTLIGLGLCGAALDLLQSDGPGFVVGYLALSGLAFRAPRWTAMLAGAPVVIAVAVVDARDSANPATAVLAVALGAGFLFGTSALAAFSRDGHQRAEAMLAREAAIRDAREQMATMAERSRLSRELHDVLAHCLSGLAVQLEAARMLAIATAAETRLVDQISSARRLAQSGMLDARRALQTLRQDEIPGPARLPYLAAEMASALGIPVTFQVEGTPQALSPEASLTVYRAVQEALTNVAKHAGRGAQVDVRLTWRADSLDVAVVDRGGDGADAGLVPSGFGLTSMAERTSLHGGQLKAGQSEDGFTVQLRLPLSPDAASGGAKDGWS
jgi:signal transduction histidine kinase